MKHFFLILFFLLALLKSDLWAQSLQSLSYIPKPNSYVAAVAVVGNTLYVGGNFSKIGAADRNYLAAINLTTGAVLPWNPQVDGVIYNILPHNNQIFICGEFTTVNGQSRTYLAALNPQTGEPTNWNPVFDQPVGTLAAQGNLLFVGGSFTSINGSPSPYLAAFDLSSGLQTSWKPNPDERVTTLEIVGNTLWVGGDFYSIGGDFRERLAAFDIPTGSLLPWSATVDGHVFQIKAQPENSTLFVAGNFSVANGQPRSKIAAFDLQSGELKSFSAPLSSNFSSYVNTLTLTPTALLVGGRFEYQGLAQRQSLCALRTPDGALLPWNPAIQFLPNPVIINASAYAGNKLIIGGNFYFASEPEGFLAVYDCPSPTKPILSATPSSFICQGRPVEINIRATFKPSENYYEWFENQDLLGSFTNQASIFTDFPAAYKVAATNACQVSISEDLLTQEGTPLSLPRITYSGTPTFCIGSSLELTTQNQPGANYIWERDGIVVGGNANSYVATQRGNYTVTVSNACGSLTSTEVEVRTDFAPPAQPLIQTIGNTQNICQGQSITLTYNFLPGVVYEWLKDGQPLGLGQNPLSVTQGGEYSLRASNSCGFVNSANRITFAPIPAPANLLNPSEFVISASGSTTFCQGGKVTLSAPFHPALSYQWFRDGEPIASGAVLDASQTGVYSVTASTACGSLGSRNTIRVNVVTSPLDVNQTEYFRCGPGFITFTALGTAGGELRLYDANDNLIDSDDTAPYVVGVFQDAPLATYFLESRIGNCQSPKFRVNAAVRPFPDVLLANDVNRCSPGVLTFTTNNLPGSTVRLYTQASGGTPIATSAQNTISTPFLTTSATYYLEAVNVWGCASDGRMPVVAAIKIDPSLRVAAASVTRCGAGPATFTVTASGPVRLYTTPVGAIPVAFDDEPPYLLQSPYLTAATTFYLETVVRECASARVPVIANLTVAPFFSAGADLSVQCGNNVTLSATQGGTNYRWEPAQHLNAANLPEVVTRPTRSQTYSVTAQFGNCEVFDTVRVTVLNPPLEIRTTASVICVGGQARITVTGGANYTWQPTVGLTPVNNETVIVSPPATVTYTVTGSVGGCQSQAPVTISVQPAPTVSAIAGDQLNVTLFASGGLPPYTYTLGTNAQPSGQFENVPPGSYTAIVTDSRGCSGQTQVNVFPAQCAPIQNLSVVDIAEQNANITWLPVRGALLYELEWRREGELNWRVFNTNAAHYQITGLSPLTRYEVRVRAICRYGTSDYALTGFLTPIACNPPINLRASNITANSALLTWRAENLAQSYLVRLEKIGGGVTQFTVTHNVYALTGLEAGAQYSVSVRSNCSATNTFDNLSVASAPVSFFTGAPKVAGELSSEELSVYPNPSKGVFTLVWPEIAGRLVGIQIFDLQGRSALSTVAKANENGELLISAPYLAPSCYTLKVISPEGKCKNIKIITE
jgi:hypothetical protein